ncbi:hypothetical protein LX32DRAFT_425922 [Colletotrichum zoysiae]|uniref:Uncharacterized protein n=1 Tax=Colletotrichum zoysiae TaxID=1216348 RepID=A0AAD9LZ29_9PEZI|nr:hypothetical protein LX32DRAFT_425922 [Colletotrichum zoysiae]
MYEINNVSAASPRHTCIGSCALVPSRQQAVAGRFLDMLKAVDVPELDFIRRVALPKGPQAEWRGVIPAVCMKRSLFCIQFSCCARNSPMSPSGATLSLLFTHSSKCSALSSSYPTPKRTGGQDNQKLTEGTVTLSIPTSDSTGRLPTRQAPHPS